MDGEEINVTDQYNTNAGKCVCTHSNNITYHMLQQCPQGSDQANWPIPAVSKIRIHGWWKKNLPWHNQTSLFCKGSLLSSSLITPKVCVAQSCLPRNLAAECRSGWLAQTLGEIGDINSKVHHETVSSIHVGGEIFIGARSGLWARVWCLLVYTMH